MSTICVRITKGDEYSAQFFVNNVNEIEAKLLEWNAMSDFEREHLTKKGTLDKALDSGWYYIPKT